MISQNEKIKKLNNLFEQGKIDSVVSLLKDESFKSGLNQHNAAFMFFMYKLYSAKEYVHSNAEKAREMLNKSTQLKYSEAYSEKGRLLLFGLGCEVDVLGAEDSFRQSLSCEQSRYYIAEIYLKGMGTDSKKESFFDFVEAKDQLMAVVAMKGVFYKSALLKLAVIILNQEDLSSDDDDVILVKVNELSCEDGVEGHNAKVILGRYYVRKLKGVFSKMRGAQVIKPESYFDLISLVDESKDSLSAIGRNVSDLWMLSDIT